MASGDSGLTHTYRGDQKGQVSMQVIVVGGRSRKVIVGGLS